MPRANILSTLRSKIDLNFISKVQENLYHCKNELGGQAQIYFKTNKSMKPLRRRDIMANLIQIGVEKLGCKVIETYSNSQL